MSINFVKIYCPVQLFVQSSIILNELLSHGDCEWLCFFGPF